LVVYRAVAYHTPLWIEPNVTDGRFHKAMQGPTQYFCEHPVGPLAEAVRRLPTGMDPHDIRRPVWALRLPNGPVETLGFDEAAAYRIDPYALVCPPDGYRDCQALAAAMRQEHDPPMLRVPSAALPGTWNLIVFGERVLAPYLPDPIDPLLDIPGAPTSVGGRALDELVPMVRPLDQIQHDAYDAWQARAPFAFVEPGALSLGG
jgi:hypothetical protein